MVLFALLQIKKEFIKIEVKNEVNRSCPSFWYRFYFKAGQVSGINIWILDRVVDISYDLELVYFKVPKI